MLPSVSLLMLPLLMLAIVKKTIQPRYIYGKQFSKKQDKMPPAADAYTAIRQIILDWLLPIRVAASSSSSSSFLCFRFVSGSIHSHEEKLLLQRWVNCTIVWHCLLILSALREMKFVQNREVKATPHREARRRRRIKYKREENNSSSCTTCTSAIHLFYFSSVIFFSLTHSLSFSLLCAFFVSSLLYICTAIRSINYCCLRSLVVRSRSHSWLFRFPLPLLSTVLTVAQISLQWKISCTSA